MSSTVPAPATAGGGERARSALQRIRPARMPSRTVLLGLAGSAAVSTGGFGAGAVLRTDSPIADGPLSWIRYGHGQDLAGILLYTGLGLLVWAWVRLGREVLAGGVTSRQVLRAAMAWLTPVLVCPPLFTRDVYSYLAQGALALRGFDPYAVGPVALPPLPIVANVHELWQVTPAPYGPLFLLVAAGVYGVTGGHVVAGVLGMRLVLLTGFGLLAYVVPTLAERLGGRRPVACWLVLANPITVIHLVGGPHNDLLMSGILATGTLLVLTRRHVAGIALVTAAMAIKPTAGMALPFLVWVWAARQPGGRVARLLRAGSASVAVFAAVFVPITVVSGWGLGWVAALSAPTLVVNWLSPPTAAGQLAALLVTPFTAVDSDPILAGFRLLGLTLLGLIAAVQWWRARDGGAEAVRRCAVVLFATAVLAPPTFPWYLSWSAVLAAGLAWSRARLAVLVGASVWLVAYTFPNGEQAQYSPLYLAAVTVAAVVAAVSLRRADPLQLHRRAEPAVRSTRAGRT